MSLVPYALELLDNNRPRARKFAISALQNLTGQGLQTEAEWKKWAQNRK